MKIYAQNSICFLKLWKTFKIINNLFVSFKFFDGVCYFSTFFDKQKCVIHIPFLVFSFSVCVKRGCLSTVFVVLSTKIRIIHRFYAHITLFMEILSTFCVFFMWKEPFSPQKTRRASLLGNPTRAFRFINQPLKTLQGVNLSGFGGTIPLTVAFRRRTSPTPRWVSTTAPRGRRKRGRTP